MLILPVLIAVFAWYLFVCYKWKKNIFDHMQKIPGDKFYPFFGTMHNLIGVSRPDMFYKLGEMANKYKPLFRVWNGHSAEINLMKPEHIQVVLRNSNHNKKGAFYDNLYDWLGDGLLISKGAKWFLQRKLLTPTFHFKILESFMQIISNRCSSLVKELESKVDGDYFDVLPHVTSCALDIICETSMGLPASAITDRKEEYVQTLYEMTEMAQWRNLRPHFRWNPMFYLIPEGWKFKRILTKLHEFSGKVISERKLLRSNLDYEEFIDDSLKKKKPMSFLDLAINASDKDNMLTDKDLRDLVDTFLFAGFDTTTTSTCWSIFLLGSHPEIQDKAYAEVRNVLQDKPAPTTLEELNQLKYLECVIKEGLRLFPVLSFISRQLSEDIELDGYKIPKGVDAVMLIAMVHRDPEHFPEPNKFDPDRFLPENAKKRHPFAYIPFSAGPRNCIGQRFALTEEKTLLASLLQKYRITSMETLAEKKVFSHTITRPQTGIKIKLENREDCY